MYAITPAGRHAWESQDASVSGQYRRFLWQIDVQGGARAVRALAREHAPSLLCDWLKDLEQLGLIDSRGRAAIDVTIPLLIDEVNMQAGAEAAASLGGTGSYIGLRAQDRRQERRPRTRPADVTVLVVEDDPDQRALADAWLATAGFRLRTAATVQALLASLIQEGAPDLLLLDVRLPDGDGFEVLGKIRRHPGFAALPIIMLTAKGAPSDIGKALALGADGYVIKPYSQDLITEAILTVLGD
jgi:CheY-like chemotaxis protein